MPRPEKERIVNTPPLFNSFKPTGFQRASLKTIILSLDEFEAVRLADSQQLDHAEAAEMMEISRSTFTRLIERARKKVSRFLIEGAELVIDGGSIHFRGNIIRCDDCSHIFRVSFTDEIKNCPSCNSVNLTDLADGFGHGRCCRGQGRGGHHGGRKN